MSRSAARRLRDGIIPFYSALVGKCPVLGSSAPVRHWYSKEPGRWWSETAAIWGEAERVESVQPGEKMSLKGSFLCMSVKQGQKWNRIRLFSVVPRIWISSNKLKHRRFLMNIRRHLVILQMSEHWHSFPRQAMESQPSKSDRTVNQQMSEHDPRYPSICNSAWAWRGWTR